VPDQARDATLHARDVGLGTPTHTQQLHRWASHWLPVQPHTHAAATTLSVPAS